MTHALRHGRQELMDVLTHAGSWPDLTDTVQSSSYAAPRVCRPGHDDTHMIAAAKGGYVGSVRHLASRGADKEARDSVR